MTARGLPGTLLVVPSPLDGGTARPTELTDTLPLGVVHAAARLSHWVVENAKAARAFLKRIDAVAPLACPLQAMSIVELPRPHKGARAAAMPDMRLLLQPLLDGHDVGLLSEAGLPAVADPGASMVAAAHDAGITVVPLAGASALTLALAASGLNGQSFAFVGYMPVDAARRAMRLRELEARSRREQQTQLMIETPYRNATLFDALLSELSPDTRLSLGVGLTLPGGWSRTRSIACWRADRPMVPADVPAVFALLAR
jgi:16S rRNA (cytidine1402-2'-O)-methyltransferase